MATKKKATAENIQVPDNEASSPNEEGAEAEATDADADDEGEENEDQDGGGEGDEKEEEDGKVEVLPVKESVVDKHLVERAVVWIRERLNETVARGQLEIGQYLLREFFGDNPQRVSSRDPTKNASFRKLAGRCGVDLPVSKSWLHNSVGVAVMQRSLPEGTSSYQKLPHSHQVALLPIHEPEAVERLAGKVLEKRMPIGKLKTLVAKQLADRPTDPRGRKPTPEVLKALARSLKLFPLEEGKRGFSKSEVLGLDDGQKREALKAAKRLKGTIDKIVEYLEG